MKGVSQPARQLLHETSHMYPVTRQSLPTGLSYRYWADHVMQAADPVCELE